MNDITLSLILTAIGLATVFSALLLFLLSISVLMRAFRDKDEEPVAVAADVAPAPAPVVEKEKLPRTVELTDVDERTAATIMAIVSDETDIPLNELRFRAIRLSKDDAE